MDNCIFCGEPFSAERQRSDEHAAPRWCRKLVPTEGRMEHVFIAETSAGRQELVRGVRNPFTTVAEDICAPCNNGWMEEMEEWARRWLAGPIQGEQRVMRYWRQVLAASWAVKTALVWESVEEEHRTMHPSVARTFHMMQRPGTRQRVWTGRYVGDQPHPLRRTAAFAIGTLPEGHDSPEHSDAYLVAFAVGQLAFLVFGHLLSGPVPEAAVPELILPGSLLPKLVKIWPPTNEVVEWPPQNPMDDADLETAVRFLGPVENGQEAPET